MRKFTLLMLTLLLTATVFALEPRGLKLGFNDEGTPVRAEFKATADVNAQSSTAAKAPRRVAIASINDIVGSYTWDYKTYNQRVQDPSTISATSGSAHVTISAGETDDAIVISGMFPNDLNATVDITTGAITIPNQAAGTNSTYGNYDIRGSFYYATAATPGWYTNSTGILATVGSNGVITFHSQLWLTRILTEGEYEGYSLSPYYLPSSTLTPAVPLVPVEVPAGLETEEYGLSAVDANNAAVSGSVYIGFDGDDVYIKGICSWLPDGWIKGTLSGTTATFAGNQYIGNYGNTYDIFFNYNRGDVIFDYDAEAGTFTAQSAVRTNNTQYYFDHYGDLVLTKVIEQPATPANPEITALQSSNYGYIVEFNVPAVDTDGNGLVTSKLFYQIFVDIDGEVSPLTFTPTTHTRLTAEMSIIPYGFTESYDFYNGSIYLNELYSKNWTGIGIKSIYNGGNETHETEIQWLEIPKKYTLAEAIEVGTSVPFSDIVALVAADEQYVYVTDALGNWARLAGFPVNYFDPTWAIDMVGTFAIEDGIPTITLASTNDIDEILDIEPIEPAVLDLTAPLTANNAPKACQVMSITGYYYNGRLYAFSGKNGTTGQGVPVEGAELVKGTQYTTTAVIELLEPWESEASGAPRRVKPGDLSAFDNIKANILEAVEVDPVATGIDDIKAADAVKDVEYFDLLGRPVGKSLENVPAGLYIGNDGTKVRK